MLAVFFAILAATGGINCQNTCVRSNCEKTTGDLKVQYSSLTKVVDSKSSQSWTASMVTSFTGTQVERERACADQCMKEGPTICKLAVLDPYQAIPTKCELFKENVYETTNVLTTATGYTTFHLHNTFCEINECQNDGVCRPDFSTDTGVCECGFYSGRLCEIYNPFNHKEAGFWNFEDQSMTNTAGGASTIGHGTNDNGQFTMVPGRDGKVMLCNGTDISKYCFKAPVPSTDTPCIKTYTKSGYCSTGFTYGFWTRMFQSGSDTDYHHLLAQNRDGHCGIGFGFRKTTGIGVELDFTSGIYRIRPPGENAFRKWVFVGVTYDPITGGVYSFTGENTYVQASLTSQYMVQPQYDLGFSGLGSFFVDNVFYFPKYSTADHVKILYNLTKGK